MSSSLKRRIGEALLFAVLLFMLISIDCKLLLQKEDWLSYSIIWSICWALGHFVAKSITMFDKGIGYFLLVDFVIILGVLFVVISLPTWKEIIGKTVVPFGIALAISNNWKRD